MNGELYPDFETAFRNAVHRIRIERLKDQQSAADYRNRALYPGNEILRAELAAKAAYHDERAAAWERHANAADKSLVLEDRTGGDPRTSIREVNWEIKTLIGRLYDQTRMRGMVEWPAPRYEQPELGPQGPDLAAAARSADGPVTPGTMAGRPSGTGTERVKG